MTPTAYRSILPPARTAISRGQADLPSTSADPGSLAPVEATRDVCPSPASPRPRVDRSPWSARVTGSCHERSRTGLGGESEESIDQAPGGPSGRRHDVPGGDRRCRDRPNAERACPGRRVHRRRARAGDERRGRPGPVTGPPRGRPVPRSSRRRTAVADVPPGGRPTGCDGEDDRQDHPRARAKADRPQVGG
jgi:hypothetical protein